MAIEVRQVGCWFRWVVLMATALLALGATSIGRGFTFEGGVLWP